MWSPTRCLWITSPNPCKFSKKWVAFCAQEGCNCFYVSDLILRQKGQLGLLERLGIGILNLHWFQIPGGLAVVAFSNRCFLSKLVPGPKNWEVPTNFGMFRKATKMVEAKITNSVQTWLQASNSQGCFGELWVSWVEVKDILLV